MEPQPTTEVPEGAVKFECLALGCEQQTLVVLPAGIILCGRGHEIGLREGAMVVALDAVVVMGPVE